MATKGSSPQAQQVLGIHGTVFDFQIDDVVSSVNLEFWYKGDLFDVLLGSGVSNQDGEFCVLIKEDDVKYIVERNSQEHCPPKFFIKYTNGDVERLGYTKVKDSDDVPAIEFTIPDGVDAYELELMVVVRSTDIPYEELSGTFRLVDPDGEPLAGCRLSSQFILDGVPAVDMGESVTGNGGHFTVSFTLNPELGVAMDEVNSVGIRIKVYYDETDDCYSQIDYTLNDDYDHYEILDVEITPFSCESGSENISDLADVIGLSVSPAVTAYFDTNALSTLKDVRSFGFVDPDEFAVQDDIDAVNKINRHARLEVASSLPLLRDAYIDLGFTNLKKISTASRPDFLKAGVGYTDVDDLTKSAFHRVASAQQMVLQNVLTAARVGVRYEKNNAYHDDLLGDNHGAYCSCKDCEAAVSPLAYLADLLKYTTEHIKKDNAFVTVSQLEELFCQPFGDLSSDCETMAEKICQYRIAVEILRCYYEDLNPMVDLTECQRTNLDRGETAYRNSAYFMLLELLGTSYDELRKSISVPYEQRKTKLKPLTDRVGIVFNLQLAITAVDTGDNEISISGDYSREISRLGKIEISGSTANDGVYTVTNAPVYSAGPDTTTITLDEGISDPTVDGNALVDTVARMYLDVENEENTNTALEGLFGLRDFRREPLEEQPSPEILDWQLAYFRENWASDDHPNDAYTNGDVPIVDPDVIGLDDLRNPGVEKLYWVDPNDHPQGTVEFPVSLNPYIRWKGRRDWIDEAVIDGVFKDSANWTPNGVVLGERSFVIGGDFVNFIHPGTRIEITGSTGNDGFYTVEKAEESSGNTTISVLEPIPDNTDDGDVEFLKAYDVKEVVAGTLGSGAFKVAGDVTADFTLGDLIHIQGTRLNRGQFTVEHTLIPGDYDSVTDLTTIEVDEDVVENSDGLGILIVHETIAVATSGVVTTSDTINVIGNGADQTDLDNASSLTISESTANNDVYVVDSASGPSADGFIAVTLTDALPSDVSDGKISFLASLDIDEVALGARKFKVLDKDVTPYFSDTDTVTVSQSSDNDGDYVSNGDGEYLDGDTIITVNEAIESSEANGLIRLPISIDIASVDLVGGTITIASDVTDVIMLNDVVSIDQSVTTEEIVYTVTSVELSGSDTIIGLAGLYDAVDTDPLYLMPAIGTVDISGKYFKLDAAEADQRSRIFAGQTITVSGTGGTEENNKDYTVESVSFNGTNTFVYVEEFIAEDSGSNGNIQFTRELEIRPSKPIVSDLFDEMQTSTGLQDGASTFPWVLAAGYETSDFSDMADAIISGNDTEAVETHTTNINDHLNLSIDAFLEMVRIWEMDQEYEAGTSDSAVSGEEWNSFINILVSGVKKNKYADWISEESVDGIKLDASMFWVSQREPKEGSWPMTKTGGVPLVDPELITVSQLPEGVAGEGAVTIYNARVTELEEVSSILMENDLGSHSEDIIRFAFGVLMEVDDPVTSLWQLQTDLNSIDEEVAEDAKSTIEEELLLTVEDFTVLMDVFSRMDQSGYQPNDEDREFYIPLLVTAYKKKRLYPVWSSEEVDTYGFTYTYGSPSVDYEAFGYYHLRKAALPKWRANAAQRQQWQAVLKSRSEVPVVDPDVVFAEDFRTYVATEDGYESYGRWMTRRDELDTYESNIDGIGSGTDYEILKERIYKVLGLEEFDDFEEIIDLEEAGVNIKARLQQLTLSITGYRRLKELLELGEASANGLLPSEIEESVNILVDVAKRRHYGTWQDEEATDGITLSQDYFKVNKDQFYNYSLIQDKLVKHRSTYKERRNWSRQLQGRIDNVEKAALAIDTVIRKTEEETLPFLRDTYIQAVGDNDFFLEENAENLSNRYLFDFKVNCCQEVTRVSQALETLQQILWTERTGVLEESGLDFELVAPYFEEEWKWIGSYADWRSAMFVFLFPENLLYPTLRRYQSPAFVNLTKNLRGSKRITPETACKEAHIYASYLEDISNLQLQATCNTKTMVFAGNCDNRFVKNFRCLFYTFAKSAKSGKIYYSVGQQGKFDAADGQGFWTEVEAFGTNCVKIFGAIPYEIDKDKRFIYVIALVNEDGERKLVCLRYDLMSQSWDEEYNVLDLPESAKNPGDYDIVVEQRIIETTPVNVVLKDAFTIKKQDWVPNEFYKMGVNQVNKSGDGWTNDDWHVENTTPWPIAEKVDLDEMSKVKLLSKNRFGPLWEQVFTILQYEGLLYLNSPLLRMYGSIPLNKLNNSATNPNGWEPVGFVGASCYDYEEARITIFYKLENGGGFQQAVVDISDNFTNWYDTVGPANHEAWNIYHSWLPVPTSGYWVKDPALLAAGTSFIQNFNASHVTKSGLAGTQLNGLRFLAPNSGKVESVGKSGEPYLYACERSPNSHPGIFRFRMGFDGNSNGLMNRSDLVRITPLLTGPFGLVSKLNNAQLLFRKDLILEAYTANASEPVQMFREYIAEAYYFIPMYIGLQLQQRGHYIEALDWFRTVYDYTQPDPDQRKIYPGLELEESIQGGYTLSPTWLQDPLNPHGVAQTRANTYTKYTVLSVIRCLEDYGDAEFTIDTAETVPRARELYKQAIQLLQIPELALLEEQCHCDSKVDDIIKRIACELTPEELAEWKWAIELMEDDLQKIKDCATSEALIDDIVDDILTNVGTGSWDLPANIETAQTTLATAIAGLSSSPTVGEIIDLEYQQAEKTYDRIMADDGVEAITGLVAREVETDYQYSYAHVLGRTQDDAEDDTYEFLSLTWDDGKLPVGFSAGKQSTPDDRFLNPTAPTGTGVLNLTANKFPLFAAGLVQGYPEGLYIPILGNSFCVPDNPVIRGLRLRAELNLFKIRNCMNIAGMVRSLDPYAAPTDTTSGVPVIGPGGQLSLPGSARISPTPYRYQVIVERAKQLVAYAQQIEANFLAAMEKRDAEYYNRMKAKQDLGLSKQNVKLQKLRVKVAEGEVDLAELQRDRASLQVSELDRLIGEGLLGEEEALVGMFIAKGVLEVTSVILNAVAEASRDTTLGSGLALFSGGASVIPGTTAAVTQGILGGINAGIAGLNTSISVTQIYASQARREQEWGYQKNLANQDVQIGNQSIKVAQSRLRVSGQEQAISELQVEHAEASLDFLNNKFTNVDLYDFMSETLEGVYSYFLMQATATAKMATNQLAFERQELPPAFILDDYWQVPTDSNSVPTVGGNAPDRRGITGSARLLQDITKLDQFAFDTDKRKLQMTKTFSLSNLAPVEFQQFKDTGVIRFETMMEYFDRDFPGHYLRLIKKVKVDVIALTPPTDGIKASLTSSGTSRVTIGGDIFQTIVARRDPETIALTGARNATGMFEMQPENQFLNPFEGSGVHMLWEFKMSKQANLFNFATIADVLISMDYTAFHDYAYEGQVLRQLPPFHSADRPFSFRSELADQFYELGHPEEEIPGGEVAVNFELTRGYFPPNIVDIRTAEFKLLFVTERGISIEDLTGSLGPVSISFEEQDEGGGFLTSVNGEANIGANNLISTAAGAGGLATVLRNKKPFGRWTMRVPEQVSDLIKEQKIVDIMMVFTYTGDFPVAIN
jgi:hypothetical protein